MNEKEIEQKARRVKILKSRQEALQAEIDRLTDDLKAEMKSQGVEELKGGPFLILWKLLHSTRFDTKRCKAEYPEIYNMFSVACTQRPFRIV